MAGVPPLAHPKTEHRNILERNSYIVIFKELMKNAKLRLEKGEDCSMVVTGNPGIGKSRFYLYCIFHLIFPTKVEAKELPSFDLVVNYGETYHKFDAESHEFASTRRDDFVEPFGNFTKVTTFKYIMPVWTLEELREYNSVVFTRNERENTANLQHAVASFSTLEIIAFARSMSAVRENNNSHLVLKMVPSRKDLQVKFYLDFLSDHIAERIIDKVDHENTRKVSEFAVAYDENDWRNTSMLRGRFYELLCHKWFSRPKQHKLVLRSLGDGQASIDVSIPSELKTARFSDLTDIKAVESGVYYRPTFKTFGALDAFFFTGNACYGLLMTRNRDHGINGASLNAFLKWLEGVGITTDRLYFTFVVPGYLGSEFKKQSIQKVSSSDSQRPEAAAKVNQFVTSLDLAGKRGQ